MTTGVSIQLRDVHCWTGSEINISLLSPSNHSHLRHLRVRIQPF